MILKIQPKINQRILVMSDIHGNLTLFNKILEDMNFSSNDMLLINGDISEKGPDSIGLFQRIIDLEKTHEVYATLGNCDELILFLNDDSYDEGMENYMQRRKAVILNEFCEHFGPYTNFQELKHFAKKQYPEIFEFVEAMPYQIHTPYFNLVHAGIDLNEPDNLDYQLSNSAFLENDFYFEKPLIVGHFPTCLYHKTDICHDAILDYEHNIFAIDGGNSIKRDGQVNVLEVVNDQFTSHRFDLLETIPAFKSQKAQAGVHISWKDPEIEILSRGEEFSSCLHVSTETELDILNDFLDFENQSIKSDYTNALVEVKENDDIHILKESSQAYYIKCQGSVGWLLK